MCSAAFSYCYAEVQPDFAIGNVSANRMQSDESWLSKAMLR